MAPTKPSLELLRSLSDEHVLRALMSRRQATRAEIAAATGLSKPTVSESVRRLSASGSVVDTGERTTGRGRVGTYYALPATTGCALVASLAPDGIVAEAIDVYGQVVARSQAPVTRSPGAGQVPDADRRRRRGGRRRAVRLAVVSAADPVDRETGRLVELPDAPFLLGALDVPAVLAELVDGPVTVDNDVNWAARAKSVATAARLRSGTSSICSSVKASGAPCSPTARSGAVLRGAGGRDRLRGDGRPGRGGDAPHRRLRRARPSPLPVLPRSTCRRCCTRWSPTRRRPSRYGTRWGRAVAGVLSAVVALTDPAIVLVGGPWGRHPSVLAAVARGIRRRPSLRPGQDRRRERRAIIEWGA